MKHLGIVILGVLMSGLAFADTMQIQNFRGYIDSAAIPAGSSDPVFVSCPNQSDSAAPEIRYNVKWIEMHEPSVGVSPPTGVQPAGDQKSLVIHAGG